MAGSRAETARRGPARSWQDMDLMTDILEPSVMDSTVMFPTNTTFLSSLESKNISSSNLAPETDNVLNSPDFNQNKTSGVMAHTNKQTVRLSKSDHRIIHNRYVNVIVILCGTDRYKMKPFVTCRKEFK